MMDQKYEEFIDSLKIEDVPWNQLTTAYGRAGDFPEYLAVLNQMSDLEKMENALGELGQCIEHQGTLWHSTPFALIFLVRIYREAVKKKESKNAVWLIKELESLFLLIVECYHDMEEMGEDVPLPLFSDMLKTEYLMPLNISEEEEDRWWDDGYDEDLFASCYYYSYKLVEEFDE